MRIVNTNTGAVAEVGDGLAGRLITSGSWAEFKKKGGSKRGVRKPEEEKHEEAEKEEEPKVATTEG